MKGRAWLFALLLAVAGMVQAEAPGVRSWTVDRPLADVYPAVYSALEEHRFFVVFEPDIGANLAHFAERWGEDYNRNGLDGIRAMVFCNAWYANQVGNADPALLALCPLHLTLVGKDGRTGIHFTRPTRVAEGSGSEAIAAELEAAVAEAVEAGIRAIEQAGRRPGE